MTFLQTTWRRYLAWLLLVCLFAVGCIFLSRWQFDRRAQVVAVINTIDGNYDQKPAALASILPSFDAVLPAKKQWLPATVSGRYIPEATTLGRNRSFGGYPGFEVLVPFLTDQNTVVIIDRGWVATGNSHDAPDSVPTPTATELTLVGRLMPGEEALNRTAPEGQIPSIYLPELATMNSAQTYTNAYLLLDHESIRQPQAKVLPKPSYGEGNHLSYAIQWIIFGLLAFGTLFWAVRKELHFYRAANDPNYVAKPKRKSATDKDADAEDLLLML
jgi:hypothetical protein